MSADAAATLLGAIRLANGVTALLAPRLVLGTLGSTGAAASASTHVVRMFGIRTALLGIDLIATDRAGRAEALRRAPLIHATDTVSAVAAGLGGQLPPRSAVAAAAISAANLALALLARRSHGR